MSHCYYWVGFNTTSKQNALMVCIGLTAGNSYNDTERCVCAGYDNGDIKLFDLRTMTQRWETNVKNGVSL